MRVYTTGGIYDMAEMKSRNKKKYCPSCVAQMKHPWQAITETADGTYLDFSVNINGLGIPKAVKENIRKTTDCTE